MTQSGLKAIFYYIVLINCCIMAHGQSNADYGNGIRNIYLSGTLGVINYNYDFSILEPGYTASGVSAKNTFAGRFAVGYHLSEHWDAQFSVMRPAAWTKYEQLSIDGSDQTVWTNIWALTAKYNFNLTNKYSMYFETGLSNVTRNGIELGDFLIVGDAHYLYPIFGSGLNWRLNGKWQFNLNATYSPPKNDIDQPATTFIGLGTIFSAKRPDDQVIARNANTPFAFPKKMLQLGYTSDVAGFDINRQFSGGLPTSIPLFWLGDVFVKKGVFATYQQTVLHTYKNFSLEWGLSAGLYETKNDETFYALSAYPLIKWWFLRSKATDVYFNYSLIGPAYISKSRLDGIDTGEEATFQDFMGIGFLFGENRKLNIDLRISHYSNGNIFTENPGVAVPLMLSFGYALY
ncbi:MAG: acyloxyacyl hydrolase [Leeuwenhoekiella sp.]